MELRWLRKDPARVTAYLNACLEVAFKENDPELVLISLAMVAKARGIAHVAKSVDVKRESLHRMLSKRGNPQWDSLFRIFKALHLRLKLEPVPA
jgi:probable addiction module antidote protein